MCDVVLRATRAHLLHGDACGALPVHTRSRRSAAQWLCMALNRKFTRGPAKRPSPDILGCQFTAPVEASGTHIDATRRLRGIIDRADLELRAALWEEWAEALRRSSDSYASPRAAPTRFCALSPGSYTADQQKRLGTPVQLDPE